MGSKMNVWVYWEGPIPFHIQVCLDSMKRVCGSILKIVTPENLCEFVPAGSINESFSLLREPAHRADCIRAALLAIHGGLYLDADTVMIKDPWTVMTGHHLTFAVWDAAPRRVLNGYVYACPDSPIASGWLEQINACLARPEKEKSWTMFGEKILTPLVDGAFPAFINQVPRSTFLPIDIDSHIADFFSRKPWTDFLTNESVCFGLNHSWMMHNRRKDMLLDPGKWKSSPLLIHQLLAHAKGLNDAH
jgi:hypothetical protein